MTDSTHNLFRDIPAQRNGASLGIGGFIVAMLIVAALVLTAIKLSSADTGDLPSLIPMDQPALLSNFTA